MGQAMDTQWIGEHQKCGGNYVEWETSKPEFINDDLVALAPEMCISCLLLDTCKVRVSFLLNGETMPPDTYNEITQGILDVQREESILQ